MKASSRYKQMHKELLGQPGNKEKDFKYDSSFFLIKNYSREPHTSVFSNSMSHFMFGVWTFLKWYKSLIIPELQ